jgi:hypothetical protein
MHNHTFPLMCRPLLLYSVIIGYNYHILCCPDHAHGYYDTDTLNIIVSIKIEILALNIDLECHFCVVITGHQYTSGSNKDSSAVPL